MINAQRLIRNVPNIGTWNTIGWGTIWHSSSLNFIRTKEKNQISDYHTKNHATKYHIIMRHGMFKINYYLWLRIIIQPIFPMPSGLRGCVALHMMSYIHHTFTIHGTMWQRLIIYCRMVLNNTHLTYNLYAQYRILRANDCHKIVINSS